MDNMTANEEKLWAAVNNGDGATAENLMDRMWLGPHDTRHQQLIFPAAKHNLVGVISRLLATETNVDISDRWGFSALHYAAMYTSLESAKFLLKHNADATHRTNDHMTPLELATMDVPRDFRTDDFAVYRSRKPGSNVLMVYHLLRAHADPGRSVDSKKARMNGLHGVQVDCLTGLMRAKRRFGPGEMRQIYDLLMSSKATIHVQKPGDMNRYGYTPLLMAVFCENNLGVRLCLEAGARRGNITLLEHRPLSAIDIAKHKGFGDIVEILNEWEQFSNQVESVREMYYSDHRVGKIDADFFNLIDHQLLIRSKNIKNERMESRQRTELLLKGEELEGEQDMNIR
jgi:hypothetical protein